MKKILLTLFICSISTTFALSKTIYGNFVFENQLVAYEFSRIDKNKSLFKLKFFKIQTSDNSGPAPNPKILENLTDIQIKEYQIAITELLKSLYPENSIFTDSSQSSKLNVLTTKLFYELKNRMEFEDNSPLTGRMFLLSENIKIYPSKALVLTNNTKFNFENGPKNFSIKKVEVQFADGGINNILVEASAPNEKNPNNVAKFRNNSPISISSKFDPENFKKFVLFHDGATGIVDTESTFYSIKLHELLRYDIILENNKEDYSPQDTIITLTPGIFSAEVFKDKTSKILTARTFTDLVGIDDQQPNGLVQIEVFRKFNFMTRRYQRTRTIHDGLFVYFQPMFALTKIEENKRFLEINDVPNIENSFVINPIEILRYQQFNFGIDLNIYNLNFPDVKSKVFFDFHYDLGRTTLAYQESETSNILTRLNYSTYGSTFYYQILPDSRFGIKTGYDVRYQSVHANQVSIPGNKQLPLINDELKWYGTYWFLGNFKTNPNSELFFRLRYHHRYQESESNFLEIQLGASFDIIRNK